MGLRLAKETDCTLFAFWYEAKIHQGISCRGELFVALMIFQIRRQGDAYDRASEVDATLGSALVMLTKTSYVVGADLSRQGWQAFISPAPPCLDELD